MVWTLAIPYIILVDDLCAVGMNIIILNQIDVQVIVWGLGVNLVHNVRNISNVMNVINGTNVTNVINILNCAA